LRASENICGDLFCWRNLIGSFSVTWLSMALADWLRSSGIICAGAWGQGCRLCINAHALPPGASYAYTRTARVPTIPLWTMDIREWGVHCAWPLLGLWAMGFARCAVANAVVQGWVCVGVGGGVPAFSIWPSSIGGRWVGRVGVGGWVGGGGGNDPDRLVKPARTAHSHIHPSFRFWSAQVAVSLRPRVSLS
jgi:hypothetical protein